MTPETIGRLLDLERTDRMGHGVDAATLNLGLGWLYYALVRVYQPRHIVVIGSLRGFVPILLGKAAQENKTVGRVTFIDPGMVDDFWQNAEKVENHFADFGLRGIVRHHLCTTEQFVLSEAYEKLPNIGLLFVDGYHTADQARFDHHSFKLKLFGPAVFHDSHSRVHSRMYKDAPYHHSVHEYISELRASPDWDVLSVSLDQGVSIVTPTGGY